MFFSRTHHLTGAALVASWQVKDVDVDELLTAGVPNQPAAPAHVGYGGFNFGLHAPAVQVPAVSPAMCPMSMTAGLGLHLPLTRGTLSICRTCTLFLSRSRDPQPW